MPKYTYDIISLYTVPSKNGLDNVVSEVNWRYQVTDEAYYADWYLRTKLGEPDSETFVAYDQLTDEHIFSWIQSSVDIDAIKQEVDKRLEEKKNPKLLEKKVPWDKSVFYTGEEEYLMVKDNNLSDPEFYFGPFKWRSDRATNGLNWLSVTNYEFPSDIEMHQKGLLPVNAPLKVNDSVNVYQVQYEDQPNLDDFYQYHEGLTWVIQNGKVIGTYFVIDRTVDEVKRILHSTLSNKSFADQISGVDVTVKDKTVRVNTDLISRTTLFQRASMMADGTSEEFKLNDSAWFTLSKDEINDVLTGINEHIKTVLAFESSVSSQIDACTTIDELKQVEI
jgi:hypothetical protein